jgi:DNA-binding NarL/FixJ family response regulator
MNVAGKPPIDLAGTRVLVVEDEFYLAIELKEAVERAGGEVLGPCPPKKAVAWELSRGIPDCAIVDINLGAGPSFETAETLQGHGIPFLFLTGYDAPSIPTRLAHIERFEKPAETNRVLAAVGRLSKGAAA